VLTSLRAWLGLDQTADAGDHTALHELIAALEQIAPARARQLARFAYLLGRVAHADSNVSSEEQRAMEALLIEEGALDAEHAALVARLSKSSNLLFGGTADFIVAHDYSQAASYDEKLALARCLFAVASSDERISMAEETEIHRITTQLRIEPGDLKNLRLANRRFLPGLSGQDIRRD
jgi:uncharacterized tellurite resistance protein B-like protein